MRESKGGSAISHTALVADPKRPPNARAALLAVPPRGQLDRADNCQAARTPDHPRSSLELFSGHDFSPDIIARVSNPSVFPSSRHGYRGRPFYCRAGLWLVAGVATRPYTAFPSLNAPLTAPRLAPFIRVISNPSGECFPAATPAPPLLVCERMVGKSPLQRLWPSFVGRAAGCEQQKTPFGEDDSVAYAARPQRECRNTYSIAADYVSTSTIARRPAHRNWCT